MAGDSPKLRSVLVVLEGPLQGEAIELTNEANGELTGELITDQLIIGQQNHGHRQITMGRDSGNWLCLNDRAASRRHCVLRSIEGQIHITDLDSRNGTFVNGLPVKQRQLRHNDQIRVGDSVFLLQSKPFDGSNNAVELDDSITHNTSTHWKNGNSLYLDEAQLNASLPAASPIVRGLQFLLRISQAVQGAQSLDSLQQRLLDVLLEAVPASAGAIVLGAGSAHSTFAVRSTFAVHRLPNRQGHPQPPIHIPAAIADQILSTRAGLLSASETGTGMFLAVPLLCRDEAEGLLYLEANEETIFDNGHLELATAVGVIAGLAIYNLSRWENLRSENERLQASVHAGHDMIGSSPAMAKVYRFVAQAAPTDSTVLIGGESGTGKELVAHALHRNSPRAAKAFVAINCAALTETLLEDELFGHERGAFTGAIGMKKGKFEVADGGTLFLDEVGELAPSLQAKLLRVLQQREFDRVGGTRPIQVDVRIIAATNRDLEIAVKDNSFRQDLFFRLNVVAVVLPPLRERREDIPLLASYFARKLSQKTKRNSTGLSPAAQMALQKYDWPGNVRELENAIERALVLGSSDVILPEDLPDSILEAASRSEAASGSQAGAGKASQYTPTTDLGDFQMTVAEAKRKTVRDALERAGGVYTEAAKLLGVHPNYLHRLVKNLGLR